jgi:2-polyprenyl-3-methyl-5-hydroxy-6-metoxy-1,4-benzoquinol methylase
MELESVNTCPVCGGAKFEFFLDAIDHTATGESFRLNQCTDCRLILTNPRPTQETIEKYYISDRYISHTGGGSTLFDRIYRTVRNYTIDQKLSLIKKYKEPGSLLDYGCGTGEFLKGAITKGWSASGVEPSSTARARINAGINIYRGLSDVKGKYDIITLWHVLEHVHELNPTLTTLRSLLNPGGMLFVAVPNSSSYDASHYGAQWAGYDVPRHLWHFTKKPMIKLLSNHGLNVRQIRGMKFDSYYVSLLSENYRHPGKRLSNFTRGCITGLRSNLQARPDNYSSLIYIAGS